MTISEASKTGGAAGEPYKQRRGQTLNLGWAREEHFLIFLLFSPTFHQFSSFSSSIWSSGRAARPATREGPDYATDLKVVSGCHALTKMLICFMQVFTKHVKLTAVTCSSNFFQVSFFFFCL